MRFLQPVRLLFSMAPASRPILICSIILACVAALLFPIPALMAWVILRHFVEGGAASGLPILPCAAALVAIIMSGICRALSSTLSHKAAFGLNTGVCAAAMEHLGKLPLHWFSNHSSGGLKKILGHDLNQVEDFIAHNITDGIASLLLPIITIIALMFISMPLALLMAALIAVAIISHFGSLKLMQTSSLNADYFGALEMLHADAVEFIQGMPDIKIFNRSTESFSRMQAAISRFKAVQGMVQTIFMGRWVFFVTIMSMSFGLLAIAGAYLHLYTDTPFANIMLFLMLGVTSFMPLSRLVRFMTFFWRASTGYNSIKTLLDTPVESRGNHTRAEVKASDLEICNLCVSYGDTQVLHDVSFTAKAGTVTAIVGPSGSGKSTIAAVIAGMEQAERGKVMVGGIPLQNFSAPELARVMSVVFQQPFIFSGTVSENIALGMPEASREDIERAAGMVQCQSLIAGLPNGYETRIGAGGEVHLSGGQCQRIALARMALRDTPVILLDEATAFADPESEAAIQEGLSGFLADKTVLVIAHRLPSIAGADAIIVLDNGSITETGTHDELIAKDGAYKRMWEAYKTARRWMIASTAKRNELNMESE